MYCTRAHGPHPLMKVVLVLERNLYLIFNDSDDSASNSEEEM